MIILSKNTLTLVPAGPRLPEQLVLQCGSDWGRVGSFKASVEGLVNETSQSLYVLHVLRKQTRAHTHTHTFNLVPHLSAHYYLSDFFPPIFLGNLTHPLQSFFTFLLCRPHCSSHLCVAAYFSLFPCQMDRAEGQRERGSG